MTFYATFGFGQYFGIMKDFYIRIEVDKIARTEAECRDIAMRTMDHAFNGKWSSLYKSDEFVPTLFTRGMLACIDEHGNRLFSKEI